MSERARNGGHALLGTMAFLVIAMLLWLGAFAAVSSDVRAAKRVQVIGDRDDVAARALAWGLTLLGTGTPPEDPYSCRASVDTDKVFVITFSQTSGSGYQVKVRPATDDDALVPYAPPKFGT